MGGRHICRHLPSPNYAFLHAEGLSCCWSLPPLSPLADALRSSPVLADTRCQEHCAARVGVGCTHCTSHRGWPLRHSLPMSAEAPPPPCCRSIVLREMVVGASPIKAFETLFANGSPFRNRFLEKQVRWGMGPAKGSVGLMGECPGEAGQRSKVWAPISIGLHIPLLSSTFLSIPPHCVHTIHTGAARRADRGLGGRPRPGGKYRVQGRTHAHDELRQTPAHPSAHGTQAVRRGRGERNASKAK